MPHEVKPFAFVLAFLLFLIAAFWRPTSPDPPAPRVGFGWLGAAALTLALGV